MMLAMTLIFSSDCELDDASPAVDPHAAVPTKAAKAIEAAITRLKAARFVELKNADTDIVPYFPLIFILLLLTTIR
ncbi:hypothetical protein BPY_16020 [Bifidobacterium psychraerophilum]